jgi:hypothetical protein
MAIKPTDALDTSSGWNLVDDEEGIQPVIADEAVAWGHVGEAYQVAGLGGAIGRGLARRIPARPVAEAVEDAERKLIEKTLRDIRNKEIPEGRRARRTDLEALEAGGEPPVPIGKGAPTPRAKMGESGQFNLERQHPGAMQQDYVRLSEIAQDDPGKILKMVHSAEDFGDALDAIGRGLKEAPRTHASIRASGIDWSDLHKGIESGGLLNDRQLFGMRTIMATLGDKTVDLAKKIYQGDHSPQTLLEYEQSGQQLIALTKYVKGQTREVARALSQQNMIADVLSGNDLKAMDDAIIRSASDPSVLIKNAGALAEKLNRGFSPSQALKDSLDRRTWLEASIEFWKANNLSAPATHAANAMSGIVVSMFETLSRVPAMAIGEARTALGASDAYRASEFGHAFLGGMSGLRASLGLFWDTLLTGEGRMGAYGGKEVGTSALQQKVGEPLGLSPEATEAVFTPAFRLMRATDEAVMVPAYMSELSGQAARDGIARGLSGDALAAHVENLVANPSVELHNIATEHARKVVMQSTENLGIFGSMGEQVHHLVKQMPVLEFLVPWIKTPARIMDYMVESSALSVVSPRLWKQIAAGGPDADVAAGKITTGTALTIAVLPLIQNMTITGAGPENPEQRAALEKQGWQQYSVRVGDSFVSYRNWADPIVGLIAGIATAHERATFARLETDVAREMVTSIFSVAEYALESSYMEGFQRLLKAAEDGSGKALAEFLGATATGAVPAGALAAAVARGLDDADRAKSRTKTPGFGGEGYIDDLGRSVKEDFKARMPGMRDDMRPRRYWDGSVMVPEAGRLVAALSPLKIRSVKQDDLVSNEMIRLGVNVQEPRSQISFGPIKLELLDFDEGQGLVYDAYIKRVGEARREAASAVVNSPGFKTASQAQAGLALDQAMEAGLQAGRGRFLSEDLPKFVSAQSEALSKVAKALGQDPAALLQSLIKNDVSGIRAVTPRSRREIDISPNLRF